MSEAETPTEETSTEDQAETTEEQPKEPTLEELLAKRPDLKSYIVEQSEEAAKRAEQRGRDKLAAEQRRQFHPERGQVQGMLASLIDEVKDRGEVTKSLSDRFENLITNAGQARIDQMAEEIPAFFFREYELSQDATATYHEKLAAGETDAAIKALIDGAVAAQASKFESESQERLEAMVVERVKQELEAQGEETNGSSPPTVPRGGQGGSNPLMLTSAELLHTDWRSGLTQAQRDQVYANVIEADERFGKDTIRDSALDSIRVFAQGQNSG